MSNAPTHKLIVINDLNRELSPIGFGFQSPIYKPSRFPVETIGQLLNISKVTAMYEVYEKDHSLRVLLNKSNYRKSFEEIWKEQNPGKVFPWEKGVKTVDPPKAPPKEEDKNTEQPPKEPEDETPKTEDPVDTDGQQSEPTEPEQPIGEVSDPSDSDNESNSEQNESTEAGDGQTGEPEEDQQTTEKPKTKKQQVRKKK